MTEEERMHWARHIVDVVLQHQIQNENGIDSDPVPDVDKLLAEILAEK